MSRKRLSAKLGGVAVIKLLVLMLVYALLGNSLLEARAKASVSGDSKPTLQERILEVPRGTMIEVSLLNKQKLRGRLGEVTSDGFSLQTAQGNQIETEKIAFADVKSFKEAEKTGNRLIWILAGVGILVVIGVIVGVASSD